MLAFRILLRGGALTFPVFISLFATDLPVPTCADLAYGPHPRQRLDFWQAGVARPAPLVIFIHGGGFQALDKKRIDPSIVRRLLDRGIHVAAVNYRYAQEAPFPACFQDVRRALQTLRSRADEWKIDSKRIGAYGGSAGAMLSLWLAFHDEMADPDSADPVARESTRLACVATQGGQITFDRHWMEQSVPGNVIHRNPAFRILFGVQGLEELDRPEIQALVRELSPVTHISADDPPVYMEYDMSPDARIPADGAQIKPWALHHVIFGLTLQVRMRALGLESELNYPGAHPAYQSMADFFIRQFKVTD